MLVISISDDRKDHFSWELNRKGSGWTVPLGLSVPIHGSCKPTAASIEEYPYFLFETGNKYQRSILGIK